MLYNRGYPKLAKELFEKSESLFDELEDDEKEQELLEQREVLMHALQL